MLTRNDITRTPRPFDKSKGKDVAARVEGARGAQQALLVGAAGCSPYLAGLIEKEHQWLACALPDLWQAAEACTAAVGQLTASELSKGLRVAKRRVALATALADLGGMWSLDQVTHMLTRLADAACTTALRTAVLHQITRKKLPEMTVDDVPEAAGMVVLAMGKMGADELNYSSDIDLICLFDETRFDADDFYDARAGFVRATRAMAATLSEITSDGYVFRTDLRLRPDPAVTPVCMAMEAAEQYYESLGRTWERAAYIKARPAAGDIQAGMRFLEALRPFVWRRHLDFAAIQDAHDMRLAIRAHKGLGGTITLPGHNMKLGRGGIREIEFFTQTRQLIAGGRDPDLRCRGTVAGLGVLADKGWIPAETAVTLTDHYTFHRTVEHRLQMVQDAQTHSLPKTDEGFERLAAMMDTDTSALRDNLTLRLNEVHALTEGFFAPSKPSASPTADFCDDDTLNRWMSYPALRSARSREIFERVKPELLTRLAQTANPKDAVLALDGFLSGLPAGVQLFSLLEANPQLTDLIVDVSGTSPRLAHYLSRNANVFDAVIGGDFFTDWPQQAGLEALLERGVAAETDYERQLDETRRWYKEWHFRIGVHLLRGLISAEDASQQYSDLARAVLIVLWPRVIEQFARKYGDPPGRGAVVVGMGSLGAGTLSAGSDLDLIVVYDALDAEASDGEKSLPSRLYYARLTQSLITALSAPMAQGKLFEVDMRLRPSGNQGPVATSWSAFQSYQREQAWVWEHLALTRACVVAGPAALAADVEALRSSIIKAAKSVADVGREVRSMRSRIQEAKSPGGLLDAKVGAGRLQEVEMMAQAGALLAGDLSASTSDGLRAAVSAGLLDADGAEALTAHARQFSTLHTAMQLLAQKPAGLDALGDAAKAFLMRTLEQSSIEALEQDLQARYGQSDSMLTAALAPFETTGEDIA